MHFTSVSRALTAGIAAVGFATPAMAGGLFGHDSIFSNVSKGAIDIATAPAKAIVHTGKAVVHGEAPKPKDILGVMVPVASQALAFDEKTDAVSKAIDVALLPVNLAKAISEGAHRAEELKSTIEKTNDTLDAVASAAGEAEETVVFARQMLNIAARWMKKAARLELQANRIVAARGDLDLANKLLEEAESYRDRADAINDEVAKKLGETEVAHAGVAAEAEAAVEDAEESPTDKQADATEFRKTDSP